MNLDSVSTLIDVLRQRAYSQPDQRVYTFLLDSEESEAHLTYSQLEIQARQIGTYLQNIMATGDRALLLYPPGLDFISAFYGCLYAGVIAVPVYPPDPTTLSRTLPRLQSIIQDAQVTVVLTTSPVLALIESVFGHASVLRDLSLHATDMLINQNIPVRCQLDVTSETVAFLQYTSGSTGKPKGVMLTHHNLLDNLMHIYECFGINTHSRGVIWLPPYHDMGLIGGILQPLYAGFPVTLMSPLDFLQRPFRWLQAISRYKATTSGGPNFAYDLCVRKITPEQKETLDLSSWELAFNGAEPIRLDTMKRFAQAFGSQGFRYEAFYPCYGLAEATLIVSGGQKMAGPIAKNFQMASFEQRQIVPAFPQESLNPQTLVGCGQSLPGQQIRIVDPQTLTLCATDQIGEIWVAGESVAKGYWQQPEETSKIFQAYLKDTDEGPFLRTGDLGFFFQNDLFIAGRLKEVIIIRGRNHYPQDIEETVEQSHPALRLGCVAAFSIDVSGEEQLVIVQEINPHYASLDTGEVIDTIRQAVTRNHQIQVFAIALVKPRSIPKTSSGKIQRQACRTLFLQDDLEIISQDTFARKFADTSSAQDSFIYKSLQVTDDQSTREALLIIYLQEQIVRILGRTAARVEPTRPLSIYGLDSLMMLDLKNEIEMNLSVNLPLASLFESPSIKQLASDILAQLNTLSPALTPLLISRSDKPSAYGPLSYGQQALWYLHQLTPQPAVYNLSRAVCICMELDMAMLKSSFYELVTRHPSLRTTFSISLETNEPVQQIHQQLNPDFEVIDAVSWSEADLDERLNADAACPLDLVKGPLLRITVYQRATKEYVLLLVTHHIVTDFWSLVVLVDEMSQLYSARVRGATISFPQPELSYMDYVYWQRDMLQRGEGQILKSHWQQKLSGNLPLLSLPTDHIRPPIRKNHGDSYSFKLDRGLTQQIKTVAQEEGVTLFMILMAAFQTLLARYSGQREIWVGTPTSGRNSAKLANVVGYFVNPIIIRAAFSNDLRFSQLLHQIRQETISAFKHQDYPFPLLVENLKPIREPSYSPLFQAMFVLQKAHLPQPRYAALTMSALNESGGQVQIGDFLLQPIKLKPQTAQFDLMLTMAEVNGELLASFEYDSDLFEMMTLSRMANHFQVLLRHAIARSTTPVWQLPILTEVEREQLLIHWNNTKAVYPLDICLHILFEQQVQRTPEATAVIFDGISLTYQELNNQANKLAHYLCHLGLEPETIVGVCMERSIEMVIGLYGILKAGCAFLPLNPSYPQERLAFMMRDAQVSALLTQTGIEITLPVTHHICLNADWGKISQQPTTNLESKVLAANLAYVIYTSGSTGQPKGVSNVHRGIVNRLLWMQRAYQLTDQDRVLQKTPFSFDISVWEFFWPLLNGACLVIARPGGHLDNNYLVQLIIQQFITTIHFVPSMLQIFLEERNVQACQSLKRIICSGEALPFDLQERCFDRLETVALTNLYGPTEASIDVTAWQCEQNSPLKKVPIGKPIANTEIYILNEHMEPTPINVAGELYIGGVGLARGYLNHPSLTAQKFVPHPFSQKPGALLYKTGDLSSYLADGNIEFLGRVDFQIKLHGVRIELGEIEANLIAHAMIRDVVVVVHEDELGDKRLVAYIVSKQEGLTGSELRVYLQNYLPDFMIPSSFVMLEALPLSVHGKINHRMLPAPALSRTHLKAIYTPPHSLIEQKIAEVWQRALQVEKVGRYDNFFDLGGHSLLLIQTHQQLQRIFEQEIPLIKLLERPTVDALAYYLSEQQNDQKILQVSQERALKQRQHRRNDRRNSTA